MSYKSLGIPLGQPAFWFFKEYESSNTRQTLAVPSLVFQNTIAKHSLTSQVSQSSGQSACSGNDRSRPYGTRCVRGMPAAPALFHENLSALTSVSSLSIDQFVGVIQAVVQGEQATLAPLLLSSSTSTSLNTVGSTVSVAAVGITSCGSTASLPSATVTWLTINS